MNYLTYEDVRDLNFKLQKLGYKDAEPYVSDDSLIRSILHGAEHSVYFGTDKYPTVEEKAVHMWFLITGFQAFNNGNKRTGLISMLSMLYINGKTLNLNSKKVCTQLYDWTKKIATNHCGEKDLLAFVMTNEEPCNENKDLTASKSLDYILSMPKMKSIIERLANE